MLLPDKLLRTGVFFTRIPKLPRNAPKLYHSMPRVPLTTDNGFGEVKLQPGAYSVRLAGAGGVRREHWETGHGHLLTVDFDLAEGGSFLYWAQERYASLVYAYS